MDCKGVEQRSGHMVRGQVAVLGTVQSKLKEQRAEDDTQYNAQ